MTNDQAILLAAATIWASGRMGRVECVMMARQMLNDQIVMEKESRKPNAIDEIMAPLHERHGL